MYTTTQILIQIQRSAISIWVWINRFTQKLKHRRTRIDTHGHIHTHTHTHGHTHTHTHINPYSKTHRYAFILTQSHDMLKNIVWCSYCISYSLEASKSLRFIVNIGSAQNSFFSSCISFCPTRSSSLPKKSNPVPYEQVIINDGDTFNLPTHKFVTPFTGFYWIHFSASLPIDTWTDVHL